MRYRKKKKWLRLQVKIWEVLKKGNSGLNLLYKKWQDFNYQIHIYLFKRFLAIWRLKVNEGLGVSDFPWLLEYGSLRFFVKSSNFLL